MARKENNFEVRTDLAVEQRERFPGDGGEIAGVALREWRESGSAVKMSEVQILDEHGARAMGKPKGVYLTLEADGMAGNDEEEMEEIAREFAMQLRRLLLREQNEAQITPKELDGLKEFQGSKSEKAKNKENRTGFEGKRILVVGLGNAFVTPDALGPEVLKHLKITVWKGLLSGEKSAPVKCNRSGCDGSDRNGECRNFAGNCKGDKTGAGHRD